MLRKQHSVTETATHQNGPPCWSFILTNTTPKSYKKSITGRILWTSHMNASNGNSQGFKRQLLLYNHMVFCFTKPRWSIPSMISCPHQLESHPNLSRTTSATGVFKRDSSVTFAVFCFIYLMIYIRNKNPSIIGLGVFEPRIVAI